MDPYLRTKVHGVSSKNLEQSIVFDIKMESLGVWRFQLKMSDYGDFVDQGVQGAGGVRKTTSKFGNGNRGRIFKNKGVGSPFRFKKKRPPLDAPTDPRAWSLRRYAQSKGLNPFAVQESVFRQGIRATHFFTNVVTDKLINKLTLSLERAGAQNLELDVVDIITGKVN